MAEIAVVTGASNGIGLWTALGLARAGRQVVCVGRSRPRLERAAAWIATQAKVSPPQVEVADFASLRQVQDAGERLVAKHPRIGLLVNNAGGAWTRREVSADGYEMTFAVNHLAPFLLTRVLLPALTAAAPSRIVTVASTAHLQGRLDFTDPMATRRYGPMRAYSQSKLANVMFTVELARRLAGTGVTANCVHPGVVGSNFGAKGGLLGVAWRLAKPFLLTSEQGAKESLRAALAPELAGASGEYFSHGRVATQNRQARDAAATQRLWAESEALVDRALGSRG